MIFCGDMSQCDLKDKKSSGFDFFTRLETNVDQIKIISLKQNHRHPIVDKILDVYNEYRN
jgi:phosphate starvation-inducible protein PhoH